MSEHEPLPVVYYSDVLCVWAYAGQVRLDELRAHFGDRIRIEHRFLDVYGDVVRRVERHAEGAADPVAAYARRMRAIAARFDHTAMHPGAFAEVLPRTSNQAHLVLAAVRELIATGALDVDEAIVPRLVRRVRSAFFEEAKDVGRLDVVMALLDEAHVPAAPVERSLLDGTALAALSQDFKARDEHGIEGSPTYVLDGGREKLFGNVGYRIIEANVTELLESRDGPRGASWC